MDDMVVAGAQQHSVADICRAAFRPRHDVVGFAPGGGDGAVRERASLIACRECPPKVRRKQPPASSYIEDLTFTAQNEGEDVGVDLDSDEVLVFAVSSP